VRFTCMGKSTLVNITFEDEVVPMVPLGDL
jgi:hypothetical protein